MFTPPVLCSTMATIDVFRSSERSPCFIKLARKGHYLEIKAILLGNSLQADIWLSSVASNGEIALHTILKYQPPAEVVQLLISKLIKCTKNQVPEEVKDMNGKPFTSLLPLGVMLP